MRKRMPVLFTVAPVFLLALAVRSPRSNPPIDATHTIEAQLSPPPKITGMLHRACGDCHSYQTKWPWYSQLEPVATMLSHDVEQGRLAMNLSDWHNDRRGGGALLAACSALETGRMPKSAYRSMHPEAALSQGETREFCSWAQEAAQVLLTSSRGRIKQTAGE